MKPKKKIQTRNNHWKYLAGALVTSALLGTAAYFLSPREISFEQAKKQQSKRAEYVSNLVQRIEVPQYLDSITYTPNHIERGAEGSAYQKRLAELSTRGIDGTFLEIGKRITHSRTEIFDLAFQTSRDEKELINKIGHEKNIAKFLYNGFSQAPSDSFLFIDSQGKSKANTDILKVMCELESYEIDITEAINSGLSEEYIQSLRKGYFHHYKTLFANGLIGDSNKINRLRTIYFKDWMKK